jgi:hypothetical protein
MPLLFDIADTLFTFSPSRRHAASFAIFISFRFSFSSRTTAVSFLEIATSHRQSHFPHFISDAARPPPRFDATPFQAFAPRRFAAAEL